MKKARRVKLWFSAGEEPKIVVFEPMGNDFPISPGHDLYVELPAEDVNVIEICVWNNGIAVVLPYPGDNTVLDHDGNVIERLWR